MFSLRLSLLVATLLFLSAASCEERYMITEDYGGKIVDYTKKYSELEKAGVKVVVAGKCMSACTLVLNYSNVCYTPDSLFVFHGPYNSKGYDKMVAVAMLMAMPDNLRSWAISVNALSDPNYYVKITGENLGKIDGRLC